jgi:3',5'-cyclic AMP phosphodiesterase CpdA
VTRLLGIADEVDRDLYDPHIKELGVDLVISCGDLPFDYLEYIVTVLNVPLLFVPGNHDPDLKGRPLDADLFGLMRKSRGDEWDLRGPGPPGCINIDGRVVDEAGLRVAGLGGSVRYSPGPNQYTQAEMISRALRLEMRARLKRGGPGIDVLVAHSPPLGVGDDPDDPAHQGFRALRGLVKRLSPRVLLHGHIHPYGTQKPVLRLGTTEVHNVVGHKVLEV